MRQRLFRRVGVTAFWSLVFLALAGCARMAPPPSGALTESGRPEAKAQAPAADPLDGARQLIVVSTADWDASKGTLSRYERASADADWIPAGRSIPVVIGKKGMGWGLGLHGGALGPGPVKSEGDLKSPAGVYSLGTGFAYDPASLGFSPHLPVRRVWEETICVENADSKYYNVIVDKNQAADPDWRDPDNMLRKDDLYRYGVFVNHNSPNPRPGAGSCIFMHLWRGPDSHTAGCTAMTKESMLTLLRWLDAGKHPVLLQFPKEVMPKFARKWGAPEEVWAR